jgi:hypothetical protein
MENPDIRPQTSSAIEEKRERFFQSLLSPRGHEPRQLKRA